MKIRLTTDSMILDVWRKHPSGYAVLKVAQTTKIEAVDTGKRIALVRVSPNADVRVSPNADRAARQLEKIREEFDIDPNGFAPRVVVVPWLLTEDPRNEQFFRRAKVIVGV